MPILPASIQRVLKQGVVLPAHPLALDARRKLDERHQRALSRYYIAAGAGGLAVGVHTTQFEIRDPVIGLFRPVLELAREEMDRADATRREPLVRIGGICGPTPQAVAEAQTILDLGYHAGLLSLAALRTADDDALVAHCRAVAEVIPVVGFYLQPAVGGRILPYHFWRQLMEIPTVVAVKIAPFNRYQTLDVVRAVVESGREDVALYTGNDDKIVLDLLTPFRFQYGGQWVERRIVGGLLGHWAVWTRRAVDLLEAVPPPGRAGRRNSLRHAPPQRRGHRLQRRPVRRGQRFRRVHLRHPRSPSPPRALAGHLLPQPPRAAQPRANGRDRPRPRLLSQPQRRRLCGQTS